MEVLDFTQWPQIGHNTLIEGREDRDLRQMDAEHMRMEAQKVPEGLCPSSVAQQEAKENRRKVDFPTPPLSRASTHSSDRSLLE